LPDSRRVVYALTGDFAFTARANLTTKWLRRVPVFLGLVLFFGLPIFCDAPFLVYAGLALYSNLVEVKTQGTGPGLTSLNQLINEYFQYRQRGCALAEDAI
jgi:hypothetical protein